MRSWIRPPDETLRDVAGVYWYLEDSPGERLILPPEATNDLVINLAPPTEFRDRAGGAWRLDGHYVSGTRTRFFEVDQFGRIAILGVRLRPWALAVWFDLPAGSLTTPEFDERMSGRISTLTTDRTFSWIVSRPIDYYNPGAYFAREAVTQLVVALLLTGLLLLLPAVPLGTRLVLVAVAGVAAVAGTYGTQMNWWGLPAVYRIGVGFNLVAGWVLATLVVSLWILRPAAA